MSKHERGYGTNVSRANAQYICFSEYRVPNSLFVDDCSPDYDRAVRTRPYESRSSGETNMTHEARMADLSRTPQEEHFRRWGQELVEQGRLKPGMTVMMTSFGAGVTWGSILMRW